MYSLASRPSNFTYKKQTNAISPFIQIDFDKRGKTALCELINQLPIKPLI